MIHIYPLPPVLPHNPYLDLLYASVDKLDKVTVRRIRPVWKEVLEALFSGGERVFHLHFFDELCQRPSRVATRLRGVLFLVFLWGLRLRGVRLVWTVHNIEPHEVYHPDLAFQLYRRLFDIADACIVHSEGAVQEIQTQYDIILDPHVIHIGNYIDYYGPQVQREPAREALALPDDGFVFMALGEIRPYKGLDLLISAFRLINAPAARLIIAGSAHKPEYVTKLHQLCGDDARISIREGFIPDENLPQYLAASDVLVLPYTHLLTSAVLLLAMSYSRPVIVPHYASIADLLVEGETGFFCQPNDVVSLAQAMERAMQVENLEYLGQLAFVRAQERDWTGIAEKTIAVYQSVFSQDGGGA